MDQLKIFAENLGFTILAEPWLPSILIATAATVVAHFIASYLLRRLLKAAEATNSTWDNILMHAAI